MVINTAEYRAPCPIRTRQDAPRAMKALGIVGAIGFAIGVGMALYIRYTLAAQGIYTSMF